MIHIPHECINGCTQEKPRSTNLNCPVWMELYKQTDEYKEANHWKYAACELANDLSMAQGDLNEARGLMKRSSATQEEKDEMEHSFQETWDRMEYMYKLIAKIPHCGDPMFAKEEKPKQPDPVVFCVGPKGTTIEDMEETGAKFVYREPNASDIKFAEAPRIIDRVWSDNDEPKTDVA